MSTLKSCPFKGPYSEYIVPDNIKKSDLPLNFPGASHFTLWDYTVYCKKLLYSFRYKLSDFYTK